MMGVQGRTTTRRIMKLEKPRPLKTTNIGDQSIESVLLEMDLVTQKLNGNVYDQRILVQIVSLCENLKIFGSQIESVYKDQLDRCYVALRNGCRDDNIPLLSRYRLLEVIELRAMNWQPNENLISYYQQKLGPVEAAEELCFDDLNENEQNNCITPMAVMSPTSPTPVQIFTGQYPSIAPQVTHRLTTPQPQQPPPIVVVNPLPLLSPGELMKSSGKFVAPVRIPGKNHFKDEIVIRNADSGKVMGLKGRRVHMIEDLSETVISLQRVAPGARERLIQITGGGEENISQAKHLIEETIRRNASPIRSEDTNRPYIASSCSPVSSRASDEMHQDMLEDNPVEYRYTVTHDSDIIRITGSNLEFVKTAKLVLDEYFSEEKTNERSPRTNSITPKSMSPPRTTPTKSPTSDTKTELVTLTEKANEEDDVFEVSKNSVVTVLRQPLIPSSSKDIIESGEGNNHDLNSSRSRRMLFAKTNESKFSAPATEDLTVATPSISSSQSTGVQSRITYSREFLLRCAASPLCRVIPDSWTKLPQLLAPIVKKEITFLDPSKHLSVELLWSGVRALSAADEEESNANDI